METWGCVWEDSHHEQSELAYDTTQSIERSFLEVQEMAPNFWMESLEASWSRFNERPCKRDPLTIVWDEVLAL